MENQIIKVKLLQLHQINQMFQLQLLKSQKRIFGKLLFVFSKNYLVEIVNSQFYVI